MLRDIGERPLHTVQLNPIGLELIDLVMKITHSLFRRSDLGRLTACLRIKNRGQVERAKENGDASHRINAHLEGGIPLKINRRMATDGTGGNGGR